MQYDQTIITPKGLIVHIRNGVASDGSAVLENFDLTHAETEYLLGYRVITRMPHECGTIYKIGRKILIRRSIFVEYLHEQRKF